MYSLKKNCNAIEFSPTQELLDKNFLVKVIIKCLKNNDSQGVIEILDTYRETSNKFRLK